MAPIYKTSRAGASAGSDQLISNNLPNGLLANALPVTRRNQLEVYASAYPSAGGVYVDWISCGYDGQIQYNRQFIPAAVPPSTLSTLIPMIDGWLIAVGLTAAGAMPSWSVGHARAVLLQPGQTTGGGLVLIESDLDKSEAVCWPWSTAPGYSTGRKLAEWTLPNPAAGSPVDLGPLTNIELSPVAISVDLTTSAVVGNRYLVAEVLSPGGLAYQIARAATAQAASTTHTYRLSKWAINEGVEGNTVTVPMLASAPSLPDGSTLRLRAIGMDAGDDFAAGFIAANVTFGQRQNG